MKPTKTIKTKKLVEHFHNAKALQKYFFGGLATALVLAPASLFAASWEAEIDGQTYSTTEAICLEGIVPGHVQVMGGDLETGSLVAAIPNEGVERHPILGTVELIQIDGLTKTRWATLDFSVVRDGDIVTVSTDGNVTKTVTDGDDAVVSRTNDSTTEFQIVIDCS